MLDTRLTGGPIVSDFTRGVMLTGSPCGILAGGRQSLLSLYVKS